MTVLEKAVRNLADALETLESKVEDRLDDRSASGEEMTAARRQAHSAQIHAQAAGRDLSGAITDLKELLATDTPQAKGQNDGAS